MVNITVIISKSDISLSSFDKLKAGRNRRTGCPVKQIIMFYRKKPELGTCPAFDGRKTVG